MAKTLTTCEVLKLARDKIKDPENWNKGKGAMDEDGYWCEPYADVACSWCALGAVRSVFPEDEFHDGAVNGMVQSFESVENRYAFNRVKGLLERFVQGSDVIKFNDLKETTHEDVMAMFDKTIAFCEAEPRYKDW